MELTNQSTRNEKIVRFALLYGIIVLLLLLILYFSTVYIPTLSRDQNKLNQQEMESFIQDAGSVDKQVQQMEISPVVNERLLDPIFSHINTLKNTYPDSVYQKVLQSYQVMIGRLDDAKAGDPALNLLNNQRLALTHKKGEIQKQISLIPKVVPVPVPNGGGGKDKPVPVPPPLSTGTIANQSLGPYYPKLLKGEGTFGEAMPYIKVNLSFGVEGNMVKLRIYFEATFNQYSSSGIDSKLNTEKIIYTAPEGTQVDITSLPKDFVYAYYDKGPEDEIVTSSDGTFTCQLKGNTPFKIGDPRSTQLQININRPITVRLTK